METLSPLHLFDATGIELEYMIVQRSTLAVQPISDWLLKRECGRITCDVEHDDIDWSNELVLHLVELKSHMPISSLEGIGKAFHDHIGKINRLLSEKEVCLLGSALHPLMIPSEQTRLWPHAYSEVYHTFHKLFDCHQHGWANLQAIHINLPFFGDDEFARLHTAIRCLLPILPAISAASPIMEGRFTGMMDTRLHLYRNNQKRLPVISGQGIPEAVYSESEYRDKILAPIYQAISPLDSDGTLQHEWLNSRAAIARFERNAIEIRSLDMQESPKVDLAIIAAVTEIIKNLVEEKYGCYADQKKIDQEMLVTIWERCIREADESQIIENDYLRLFGHHSGLPLTSRQLWKMLLADLPCTTGEFAESLSTIQQEGPLARRIINSKIDRRQSDIVTLYQHLAECLAQNRIYHASDYHQL